MERTVRRPSDLRHGAIHRRGRLKRRPMGYILLWLLCQWPTSTSWWLHCLRACCSRVTYLLTYFAFIIWRYILAKQQKAQ